MPGKNKPKPPLGEILKARRLALGLTQSEVAERAGLIQVDIHRLESGKGTATVARGCRVARVLGLERDDLVD